MKPVIKKQLNIYQQENGTVPFIDWLESLKDKTIRHRIQERLDRVSLGNLGDHKALEKGVSELRLSFGSGYCIYYGEQGNELIILLCGGDKSSQKKGY